MIISLSPGEEYREMLETNGKNPEDYALVRIHIYSDEMNARYYHYKGEGVFLLPKEYAEDVALVAYDFTHTNIRFMKEDEETVLFSDIGVGYSDIGDVIAFHVGD